MRTMRTTINGGVGTIYCELCGAQGQISFYWSGRRRWFQLPEGWWASEEFSGADHRGARTPQVGHGRDVVSRAKR
jgi:hypothetical protein